jgi:hypothetical protein
MEADRRLYGRFPQWRASEAALVALADKFSGFSDEAVLLKTVVINGLCRTNAVSLK